ncbi:outer membrane lipoprotein-sorting protein [Flammeovirga kamogawensis]|uniref:Outer membrane lipoprotein-sorting protein n=1 Tax=Flammeovirga kamogawensis TaxID=373891 RepID=A0ABX8H217_9BACT|nr:outer membrane lipoprotein-sorting protein [Flammeovirga kamogawensis]MBB6464056.1 outer membrane lipoprotein-sorting protein [Flammeovirga kamogawensis]QWG09870.1 outer membrane lipoprotein-sorting protein [Flammeovirga kamogawensis]TRX65376.1 outer membrane lipoprotein-sorting protein [Flammeovirga kamogawensis]
MKKLLSLVFALITSTIYAQDPVAMLKKIDDNMYSATKISTAKMIVHGKRKDKEIVSKGYSRGTTDSFTEYLSPAREKGTKMLKLDDKLWIYSPSSDRTIQISGHMLRQSVNGSDMSYEDMMQERKLVDMYAPTILGEEEMNGELCYILELEAIVDDPAYQKIKMWVDKEHYVPMRQDLFAKSGQMLKTINMEDIRPVNGKYYPFKMNYKDVLKDGKGTDFIIIEMEDNVPISDNVFNKANLKK